MRITDLFDNYHDSRVKLKTPEEIFSGQKDDHLTPLVLGTPQKKSRGQKSMLIAASLMLALTGVFVGALAMSRTSDGSSLAEGAASMEMEGMELSEFVSAEEENVVVDPLLSAEIRDGNCTYVQEGSKLTVTIFAFLPQEMETMENISLSAVAVGENVTPEDDASVAADASGLIWIDPAHITEAGTVNFTKLLTVTDADTGTERRTLQTQLTFLMTGTPKELPLTLRISADAATAETNSVAVPYYGPDHYATGGSCVYAFHSPSNSEDYATITSLVISESDIQFTYEFPGMNELESGEQLIDAATKWANIFMETCLETGGFRLHMQDGTIVTGATDTGWAALPYDIDLSQYENTGVLTLDISKLHLAPSQIINMEFDGQTSVDVRETDAQPAKGAQDANGDGILEAVVDLPVTLDGDEGTLLTLDIDLSTGEYTWNKIIPSLTAQLDAVADGDFDLALNHSAFNENFTAWGNKFLETYQRNAYLVFTDGTMFRLGSGDRVTTAGISFQDTGTLAWMAEDYGIDDLSEKTIAYLDIDGERFEFE